jgi:hypothetical protein
MSSSTKQTAIRVAVAGVALGLVVVGCGKDDGSKADSSSSSASSSATSSAATSAASSAAPTSAAAAPDYSSLVLKVETIPSTPPGAFIAEPPQLNTNTSGIPGVKQSFHTADNSATIEVSLLVVDATTVDPVKMLDQSREGMTTQPMPSVAPNATLTADIPPADGGGPASQLLFSEQNVLVSLKFISAPGDTNPVPLDFVESVGAIQRDAIQQGLPK